MIEDLIDVPIYSFSAHKVDKRGSNVVGAAVFKIQIRLPIIDDG